MCGICGIFDQSGKPIDVDRLNQMIATLDHRGPDGEGRFAHGEIGLAHRRLSIIDVNGGAQPMTNEDATVKVIFNGEIYNFIELYQELTTLGHTFRTRSDTEVIVHAYEQWGTDCVTRFNGMFGFAIWDTRSRRLFVARDHLGIKPLYYTVVGQRLLFASEIKALLQDPECPREIDLEALGELFTFRYVPSPKTLFKGIFKLPPGHRFVATEHNLEITRFWTWIPQFHAERPEEELIEEYQTLLEDAVRLQLRSDVPLGLFLSSGVDSGTLLSIMSRYAPGSVQTFTIGFDGGGKTNEVEDAARLAQHFDASQNHVIVGPDDYARYFEHYMWHLEEPVGHEAAPAFHFVANMARRHVKVSLCGQGVDEPWAGYDRHKGVKLSSNYRRLPTVITNDLAHLLARLPGRMERIKRGLISLGEADILTRFVKVYSFFNEEMKANLFQGALKRHFDAEPYGGRRALARLQTDVQHLDPLTQMLYIDTRANLPDDLLMVGDKTSMSNSLETRVPYLDYRLVEFIESLPPKLKLKGFNGKYLHKKSCEKWLPRNVIRRKKKGFDNPIDKWFRTRLKPLVDDCLLSSNSTINQYFDRRYIRRMLELHREGKEPYCRHIYLLVSLELWHRTFIKAPTSVRDRA